MKLLRLTYGMSILALTGPTVICSPPRLFAEPIMMIVATCLVFAFCHFWASTAGRARAMQRG